MEEKTTIEVTQRELEIIHHCLLMKDAEQSLPLAKFNSMNRPYEEHKYKKSYIDNQMKEAKSWVKELRNIYMIVSKSLWNNKNQKKWVSKLWAVDKFGHQTTKRIKLKGE